ncbi:MAG: hypothetical protein IPL83_20660 [Bdellovibrionales bacterium]|nr:hypothetical protein [Bdellovibrionales bacterium]
MNTIFRFSFLLALWGSALSGCSPPANEFLIPRPDPTVEVKNRIGDIKLIFKPQVDILFVVDSSGSMMTHQRNLSSNIDLFTNGLSRTQILDYHIGVTTTDFEYGDVGVLRGTPSFVERSTTDGLVRLKNNLLVGTSGSGTESVFYPTYQALSEPNLSGVNRLFYRSQAYLALVFVTDAADHSKMSADALYQFLMNLKSWDKDKLIAYGVIVPSADDICQRDDPRMKPLSIEEFLHMVKGLSFSLCATDFGNRLGEIGDDLVKKVGMFIPLKQLPVVSTIRIRYGKQEIPEDLKRGWSYDPERVGINLGAEIELEEQSAGTDLEIGFIPALLETPK